MRKALIIDDNLTQAKLLKDAATEFFIDADIIFEAITPKKLGSMNLRYDGYDILIIDQELGDGLKGDTLAEDILGIGYSGSCIIYTGDIAFEPCNIEILVANKGDTARLFELISEMCNV